jgi:hypothetical protein
LGAALLATQARLDAQVREVVHLVTELPPLRADVTEHRLRRLRRGAGGAQTRATLPPEIPSGAFGPRPPPPSPS